MRCLARFEDQLNVLPVKIVEQQSVYPLRYLLQLQEWTQLVHSRWQIKWITPRTSFLILKYYFNFTIQMLNTYWIYFSKILPLTAIITIILWTYSLKWACNSICWVINFKMCKSYDKKFSYLWNIFGLLKSITHIWMTALQLSVI